MGLQYTELRQAIYQTKEEFQRFRQLMVNAVLATDIMDKELKALRNSRWEKTFAPDDTKSQGSDHVTAVHYSGDAPRIEFVDKEFEEEYASLRRVFPGDRLSVVSRSMDNNRMIVRSSAANTTTRYYYMDVIAGSAAELATTYPGIDGLQLPVPQPITYEARDGLTIPGYLTLPQGSDGKNIPFIIHPHGGPASRDNLVFNYWVQYFASRGWGVLQMNFRGSTGYSEAFQAKGYGEWGGKMQTDVTDGIKWLIDQGYADPQKICMVGGSYGGYVAIQEAIVSPDLIKCAVGLNGVYDMVDRAQRNRRFLGSNRRHRYLPEDPKSVSPVHNVDQLTRPVLIAWGEDDRRVDEDHSQDLISRLKRKKKDYVAVELKDGRHSLNSEVNRLKFFHAMDAFLQEHLGLGQVPDMTPEGP